MIARSASWELVRHTKNKIGCQSTDDQHWLRSRQRLMVPAEHFAMMGLPATELMPDMPPHISQKMAGNMFCGFTVSIIFMAVMAHVPFDLHYLVSHE